MCVSWYGELLVLCYPCVSFSLSRPSPSSCEAGSCRAQGGCGRGRPLSLRSLKLARVVRRESPSKPARWSYEQTMIAPTYLYVIACRNDSFYVGVTHDLEHRFFQHMRGTGSTWTRRYGFLRVVTAYLFSSRHAALRAEIFIGRLLRGHHPSVVSDETVETRINHRYAAQCYRRGSSGDVEQAENQAVDKVVVL